MRQGQRLSALSRSEPAQNWRRENSSLFVLPACLFCGCVTLLCFACFPLGDRSSWTDNRRGGHNGQHPPKQLAPHCVFLAAERPGWGSRVDWAVPAGATRLARWQLPGQPGRDVQGHPPTDSDSAREGSGFLRSFPKRRASVQTPPGGLSCAALGCVEEVCLSACLSV